MLRPVMNFLSVELLLNTVIREYLTQSFCISFFSDFPLNFQTPGTLGFTYIIPDEENLVNQLVNVSETGCSDYIVYMKEPHKFMIAFERVVHIGNIRRNDRKVVIIHSKFNYPQLSTTILSMEESGFVANILIVEYYKNESRCMLFDFITHKFVGSQEEIRQPLYLGCWNSCKTFDKKMNLFPHNMNNLRGKILKVACFTYKPYVILDLDRTIEPLGRDGIEIRIADELCRWINCTIEIIREDLDQWGEIYENGTGNGVIGSVVEDRADIGIGALYSWYEEWIALDFSAAGVRTAITCVAPAPRLLSSWKMPLMPFTWYSWLAVIITFFYASLGILIAEEFSLDCQPFLTVFGMMISQSQNEHNVNWKIRSVTGWLLIIALILGCAYGAGLASTFTVPRYEPSIDTMQDIVDRNMEWGATHDAWIFSLTLSTEELIKKLLSQFRIYSFDDLKKRSFTRNMAFSIEKLPAGTFAIGEYLSKEAILDMMLMTEDFYYEQCVIMMRKSSPYSEKISALIGRLHQSGILLAWETQVALKHLNYKVQIEVKLSRSKNDGGVIKPLNMTTVEGIFAMYITGALFSLAVFLAELAVYHCKTNKELKKDKLQSQSLQYS